MSQIYLVQHGIAKSKDEAPERPLTDQGKKDVEKVAAWAAQAKLEVREIRHSGKTRAQETAEMFGSQLKPENGVVAVSGMGATDDVNAFAESVIPEKQTLMFVGHLPFLDRFASRLVLNDPERSLVQFRNGGIVGIVESEGKWLVNLLVTPEVV
ncbi:phosphohistidine phosphatase SixA [candidate division KSB1 bacterium]|nr:phosphohistidine phosphatase SixA [candidate division KSB1 bacterium]NIR69608.1 phosphohistidine phosphatase SixA [candidate division KSB1 bacterium]NIS24325.1 phosphohistidine phosphatase SixA [candidate division KSB1 bacterium]NIT71253.1 phosphohistidine phosphatase SixA [candidate division KSB1 bacterium]NIU24957.1 phosphohistidine phosphatase SixA [candidate division KSB1 bacterium]